MRIWVCHFIHKKSSFYSKNLNVPLKGYSSDHSHFSEINVKLAEKNKYATHSVQRSLDMCENMEKTSVSEDFRQKMFYQ